MKQKIYHIIIFYSFGLWSNPIHKIQQIFCSKTFQTFDNLSMIGILGEGVAELKYSYYEVRKMDSKRI